MNGALISRSVVFELKALEKEDIKVLISRAVCDTERGMVLTGRRLQRKRLISWRMCQEGMPGWR